MKYKFQIIFLFALLTTVFSGCESLLENDLPDNQLSRDVAIRTKEDLQELNNAMYDVLANGFNGNGQRFSELLADNVEVVGNTGFLVQVYNRASDFFNSDVGGFYSQPYTAIVRANSILENLDRVELTEIDRNRFEGEAKFVRAMCHFELVRLFAQPFGYTPGNTHLGIVIKTSSKIEPKTRATVAEVYTQVIADLTEAEVLLPEDNGVYATRYAAKAYLAKVYFQMNDFANAAAKADEVINSNQFTFSDDINNRLTEEISTESIFSTVSNVSVSDNRASLFKDMYRSVNDAAPTIRSSQAYLTLMTSNPNDARSSWVDVKNYNSITNVRVFTKFDSDFMNVVHASLTEMLLISAESHAELGTELSTAEDNINMIKERAGVVLLSGSSAAALISEARTERQKEFGGEGNRVHELKRIGMLGEPVIVRGAPFDCNGMVLQFPSSENSIVGFQMNPQGGCN